MLLVCRDLNQGRGGYAAFGMDLMMAILFVGMIVRRRSLRGRALIIATLGWNLLYAGLIWRQARQEGVPLWRA